MLNLRLRLFQFVFFAVLICILGLQTLCFAQSPSENFPVDNKRGVKSRVFGIKAGIALSKFVGGSISTSGFNAGPVFGVFYSVRNRDRFSFQPELLYVNKGHSLDGFETKVELYYIDLPIIMKMKYFFPYALNGAAASFFVGPSFSVLISAKLKLPDGKVDTREFYNDIDVGIVMGSSIDLIYGDKIIVTDLRFTLGARDIINDNAWNDGDIRNASSNLTIGYQF